MRTSRAKTNTPLLFLIIVLGMAGVVGLANWMERHRKDQSARYAESDLYLDGRAAKRLSLAFNGLVADWYWMRSLQYLGRKVVNYQDASSGPIQLDDLSSLELRRLGPMLRNATTLDPQFMAPYLFGAMILPTFNSEEAIALLNYGIQQNPNSWRLHQHLGYIYWKRQEFDEASKVYARGAKLPGAPRWMSEMAARVAAEGGSRRAAREMYQHLYDETTDPDMRALLARRIMAVDSFEERDLITKVLDSYAKQAGKCAGSWRDVTSALVQLRLRVDRQSGAPLDPAGTPYRLVADGCKVDLDPKSQVPYR